MTTKIPHQDLADNLKRALRSAANRYNRTDDSLSGRQAAIHDTAIETADDLPIAKLLPSTELVIDLNVGSAVFIPRLAQFGFPYKAMDDDIDINGYVPITAKKLVAGLTRNINDGDKAYDAVEPYFKAIINLSS